MSSDDGGALRIIGQRRRPRAVSGDGVSSTGGFAAYEGAQGPGLLAKPIEAFKFEQDADVWRLTSADREVVFADGTFTPEPGLSRGELDFSQEDSAQNLTVTIPAAHDLARLFIAYNPTTPVTLTIWRRHRGDAGEVVAFSGTIVSWTFQGSSVDLTCAPVSQSFQRKVPALVFQSHCVWALYGPGCGLDKEDFRDSGFVSEVSGTAVRATVFASHPDGWYTNGWAELASGEKRYIVDHVGDRITLQVRFSSLAVGQAIDAFAGCPRTEQACEDKFDNLVNHLGFPRVPTRNPYGGSLV